MNAQNVTITEYVPVDPHRVYDSRTSPAIPGGLLHAGDTLTLTTGLDTTVFFGFMWNITVTQTVGKGYFGVFPNDIAWPGNSSINSFTGSEDVSNNCYQRIPTSNGQIQIVCGGTADAAAAIIFDANAAAVFQSVASPTSVGDGALPQFEVVSLESS